jgi:hypothetical protein
MLKLRVLETSFRILSLRASCLHRKIERDWEIIADSLSKAGWSWGCVPAIDSNGRSIWIVDAHRDDGKRFIVRADEKLAAFLELESALREAPTNTVVG